MYKTGALIVNSSKLLLPALAAASRVVSGVLYVPLHCQYEEHTDNAVSISEEKASPNQEARLILETSQQVRSIYFQASRQNPLLDVRILLPPLAPIQVDFSRHPRLQYDNIDILLSPLATLDEVKRSPSYQLLAKRVTSDLESRFEQIKINSKEDNNLSSLPPVNVSTTPSPPTCNDLALGGTFDNIHSGHQLLLTQSALLAKRRVVVGITTGPLLVSKILPELIKPTEERVAGVKTILSDVKPWIEHDVVPISDVYGPTAWDDKLECLVVSPETARGGEKVNMERERRGLKPLTIYTIDLIDRMETTDVETHNLAQEEKLSSSDVRRNMLGHYRKAAESCCLVSHDPSTGPYLIGLTGGIASGKSAILKRLIDKGAYAIDCDKLGHEAYKPGTSAYSKIIEAFGEGVLNETGEIDRTVLGPIVFSDKAKLELLNEIVWPEIWRMTLERIQEAHSEGYRVCVIDAAVMLKAGWQKHLHEVWVTIAPENEVVKRIMDRDGLTEDAAKRRISAQLSNVEYVRQANVVFSTQWEPKYTQKQVDNAWKELQDRISQQHKSDKVMRNNT